MIGPAPMRPKRKPPMMSERFLNGCELPCYAKYRRPAGYGDDGELIYSEHVGLLCFYYVMDAGYNRNEQVHCCVIWDRKSDTLSKVSLEFVVKLWSLGQMAELRAEEHEAHAEKIEEVFGAFANYHHSAYSGGG